MCRSLSFACVFVSWEYSACRSQKRAGTPWTRSCMLGAAIEVLGLDSWSPERTGSALCAELSSLQLWDWAFIRLKASWELMNQC